ncbi:MAG: hypothetical protein DWQ07_04520 [Chloroflexi bacterium]|nr:MAG: hypothetical protein DWQ07_04520 [Chloroflexota bacterium]MBL1194695.1 hypothetical protein [Chloroflexota bacterium]NOH11987.1 hypothetical protein [Chloroflexota bacterium]
MKSKTFLTFHYALLALILLLALGLAVKPAYADTGGGTGTLIAEGDGLAGLIGDGEITLSGNGGLWIKDAAGDAVIEISGRGQAQELRNGWVQYMGFNGEAHVTGSHISVVLSGVDISVEASGTGRFFLRGSGWYEVNGQRYDWTPDLTVISIGEPVEIAPAP